MDTFVVDVLPLLSTLEIFTKHDNLFTIHSNNQLCKKESTCVPVPVVYVINVKCTYGSVYSCGKKK